MGTITMKARYWDTCARCSAKVHPGDFVWWQTPLRGESTGRIARCQSCKSDTTLKLPSFSADAVPSSSVTRFALLGLGVAYVVGWNARASIRQWVDTSLSESLVNVLGFTGGFLQLGAVLAVSRGYLSNTSSLYHFISLLGSSGLLLNAFYYGARPAVVVNLIWMGMNVVGMIEGVSNQAVLAEIPLPSAPVAA